MRKLIDEQAAIDAVVDALKRIPTAAILAKNAIENVPVAEVCEDAVSREAAMNEAYNVIIDGESFSVVQEETLLGLPSVVPKLPECEDAVSRADMLDVYAELYDIFDDSTGIIKQLHKTFDKLRELPSVVPKHKKGEWMPETDEVDAFWVCSACGFPSEASAANILYNYCPNCGANLRGVMDE